MKALVKSKPEPGVWMEEAAVPEIGSNDAYGNWARIRRDRRKNGR
jgi:hypothetical protein